MLISKGLKNAACDGNKHFVSLVQFLFVFFLLCREFFLWSIYVFHSRKWTKLSRNSTLVAGLNHPIREQQAKGGKREKFLMSDIYIYFSSAHANFVCAQASFWRPEKSVYYDKQGDSSFKR